MDRPLDAQTIKKLALRKYLRITLFVAAVIAVYATLTSLLSSSVDRKDIRTSVVRRGSIEASISASGTTIPNFEQALTSPSGTRLLAVLKHPGDAVRKGESILELDPSELNLALEQIGKELLLKENQKTQLRLEMDRTLGGLDGQLKIKKLRLEYLTSKRVQGEKMMEIGAISRDQMDQSMLEERIASIEKDDLEKSMESTKLTLGNQLESLGAEIRTLTGEKEDVRRRIRLLACEAERDGVVTWIRQEIGASIQAGEVICRVADLSSFHVDATLSDIHSRKLHTGMEAVVVLQDTTIPGTVTTVYPNVENGAARITITLADASNSRLRPNMRVDVSLVTAKRDGVLILKKGSYLTGANRQSVFVVKGNSARRVDVTTGVTGLEDVEIIEGLNEGDEAIISDLSNYEGRSEITIH